MIKAAGRHLEPYFRAEVVVVDKTNGKKHGTGLSAYSARLIAELPGARIRVDSSVPDFTPVDICFPGHPGADSNR